MRRPRVRKVAAAAALLLAVSVFGITGAMPAYADEIMPAPSGEPVKADGAKGSVAYIVETYHVDEKEAIRRLELQRVSPQIQDWLSNKYPDQYAGTWIDQQSGGVLKIAATRPEMLAQTLRALPDNPHIQVVKTQRSLKELESAEQRLDKALNTSKDPKVRSVEVTIDVPNNVVHVLQRDLADEAGRDAKLPKDTVAAQDNVIKADPAVSARVAAEGGRADVKQLVVGQERDTPVSSGCDPRSCTPPMRAGMRLNVLRSSATPVSPNGENLNAWWGQCTNGLNMYSGRSNQRATLTAGHCTVGCYKSGVNYSYFRYSATDLRGVGKEVYNFENGSLCNQSSTYPLDYSIMPYQGSGDFNYWLGPYSERLADSWCWWSESTKPCTDGSFRLRGYQTYSNIGIGWVACGTGSGDNSSDSGYSTGYSWHPGTRCGEVIAKDGGIKTNICSRPGDSGGPLFSEIDGMSYGILSNGTPNVSGVCLSPAGTEWSSYSPTEKIINHVKSQTLYYEGIDYQWGFDYLE